MAHKRETEEVVWTPDMPDRRLNDRRAGLERRQAVGQALHVPTPRNDGDRRQNDRRRMTLTITGRAMNGGFEGEDES
ncbi:MAG: hypothetical protein HYV16_04575 [Gammaproteobacteria bacterium]|nr:hypothetical protein [Gammaproteobacteria bacterium]